MFTSFGIFLSGLVIGVASGFVWGAIRERKGMNKK